MINPKVRHFSSNRNRKKLKLIKSGSNYLREQYRTLRKTLKNMQKKCFFNNLESSVTNFYSNGKNSSGKLLDILLGVIQY